MVELLSFYRQGHWDTERLSNLADVAQPASGGFDSDIGGLKPEPTLSHRSVLPFGSRKSRLFGARPSSHSLALAG